MEAEQGQQHADIAWHPLNLLSPKPSRKQRLVSQPLVLPWAVVAVDTLPQEIISSSSSGQ